MGCLQTARKLWQPSFGVMWPCTWVGIDSNCACLYPSCAAHHLFVQQEALGGVGIAYFLHSCFSSVQGKGAKLKQPWLRTVPTGCKWPTSGVTYIFFLQGIDVQSALPGRNMTFQWPWTQTHWPTDPRGSECCQQPCGIEPCGLPEDFHLPVSPECLELSADGDPQGHQNKNSYWLLG